MFVFCCLFVCFLFVSLFVYLFVCLFVFLLLFVCLFVCLFICLFVGLLSLSVFNVLCFFCPFYALPRCFLSCFSVLFCFVCFCSSPFSARPPPDRWYSVGGIVFTTADLTLFLTDGRWSPAEASWSMPPKNPPDLPLSAKDRKNILTPERSGKRERWVH